MSESTPEPAVDRSPPARMDDDKIRELARHIMAQSVIHAGMMDPATARMVFMPLMFIDWSGYDLTLWESYIPVGILGVHTDTGRAISGWPTFMEFQWVHLTDLNAAILVAQKLLDQLGSAPVMRTPAQGKQPGA